MPLINNDMNNESLNKKDICIASLFVLIGILQTFALFQSDNAGLYNSAFGNMGNYLQLLFCAVAFFLMNTKSNRDNIGLLILSAFMAWSFEFLHTDDNVSIFSILTTLTLIVYLLSSSTVKVASFILLRYVMIAMSFCGIIACISFAFSVFLPFNLVDYYTGENGDLYANFGVSYILVRLNETFRLCGLFNEPGLMGTMGALTVIADKMKMNKGNIIIIIASFLTFSVAFFVLVTFYVLAKGLLERNMKIICIAFIIIISLLYLTQVEFENSNLSHLFSRFSFEDGKFIADTRVHDSFQIMWNKVCSDSNLLWFGMGKIPSTGSSSYKIIIVKHGLIGFFMIFFPMVFGCLKLIRHNTSSILLVLSFILSIYQRPLIFNMLYFVILVGGITYINSQTIVESENNIH